MLFQQYLGLALLSVVGTVTASPIELSSSTSANPSHGIFKRVASNIACNNNHGALGSDCVKLISQHNNDQTIQRPDKNGRVGIYYGSCLATVNYYSNTALYNQHGGPVYTNDALAEMAYEVYAKCFQGNTQIYKSGVGYTDKTNSGDGKAFKFCLCNNNSGGSC
ncbi:uncharacterized protein K460DRAFT_365359 [Cucurbitaria berberidis CBS 394.84]|uniref:Secreted protein n=1 Tax=Cucurbitaria berberidis CBS 394.84 TaxID=1168544 RepID=A0A9P4GQW0_9PLEO|nr:uncharacterized protein K460DRAFT_365359 [Cucurbitaria berberidis CBS 394.84]KAF1849476.1 hypothetical protein K460DRAFT_365359 [Cucurbitaria berberidis CBS 394.84]